MEEVPVRTVTEAGLLPAQDDSATEMVYSWPGSRFSITSSVSFVVLVLICSPSLTEML